ncbi:MAG TPA: class I SAM-dependent methyltransferase [Tepidiformaceae bacterium]|nr:class I SAM-dependent methyltransferase [Tepidiformaceae bacterium]
MGAEIPDFEPANDAEMAEWIAAVTDGQDAFADVRALSDRHREEHGCDVYPSGGGPLLGALAGMVRPVRALEVGCGLGYSALWIAHGGGEQCWVQTIEADPGHAEIAKAQLRLHGFDVAVEVLQGRSSEVLRELNGPYDFAFFDGDPEGCLSDLDQFGRTLRPGGVLVSSNLFLARHVVDASWIPEVAAYRRRLLSDPAWQTAFLPNGKAVSVRR